MVKLKSKKIFIWVTRRGMTKALLSAALVMLLLLLFSYDYTSKRTWTNWTLPLAGQTIVLDAGHGGVDGGAESDAGLIEKDVTLALSLLVRDYLQQAGAVVVMTRDGDYDLASASTRGFSRRKTEDLLKRAVMIKEAKADLFVTIHLNSVPSSRWSGAQTFYYPKREESRRLATLIQEEIKGNLGNTTRVANTVSTVYLLRATMVPSALVEVGFLSNPREAQLMQDAQYQRKLAASIYRGILRFSSGEQIGTP
jgi:N-acetylmuramoyl-L-alanine amidase